MGSWTCLNSPCKFVWHHHELQNRQCPPLALALFSLLLLPRFPSARAYSGVALEGVAVFASAGRSVLSDLFFCPQTWVFSVSCLLNWRAPYLLQNRASQGFELLSSARKVENSKQQHFSFIFIFEVSLLSFVLCRLCWIVEKFSRREPGCPQAGSACPWSNTCWGSIPPWKFQVFGAWGLPL